VQVTGESRPRRAGEVVEDLCRACKVSRDHTVIVVDAEGRPLRVQCDFCGSQHNYRGGAHEAAPVRSPPSSGQRPEAEPVPVVTDRDRTEGSKAPDTSLADLEMLLRRIIREESGLTPVVPAEKWRGGHMVLRPGKPGLQEKTWPIETFFRKIVTLRNRLRTLEQQVNGSDLPDDQKLRLQSYITGCYGALTSFNVLFADRDDHFRGAGGSD
jgi:hypothetical protein